MTRVPLKTLRNRLRTKQQNPPSLEELRAWAEVNLQLYQEEKDQVGEKIFLEIVEALRKAKNLAEVEKLVGEEPPPPA